MRVLSELLHLGADLFAFVEKTQKNAMKNSVNFGCFTVY